MLAKVWRNSPTMLVGIYIGTTTMKNRVSVLVAQSCPTLCNPMDCSPPGSSVPGISQARILEWVATLLPNPGMKCS